MRKYLTISLFVTALACTATAEPARKGTNGGDVVVMQGHPIEFVASGLHVLFYILDHDGKTPKPTNGFVGRAVVQDSGHVTLAAAEPNMFVGELAMPLGSKARVVFSANIQGHNLQVQFTTD
jgi:hypothetical protein